jgi:1-acyl-sn-glycerol-3-phosphate acyltransferase
VLLTPVQAAPRNPPTPPAPRPPPRRRGLHSAARSETAAHAARGLLRAIGVPLDVEGLEHLPAGPCVLVSNHGSYADGVLLVAALPRPCAFVAKRELLAQPIARIYLQRLGADFVERADVPRSVAYATRLADTVACG